MTQVNENMLSSSFHTMNQGWPNGRSRAVCGSSKGFVRLLYRFQITNIPVILNNRKFSRYFIFADTMSVLSATWQSRLSKEKHGLV